MHLQQLCALLLDEAAVATDPQDKEYIYHLLNCLLALNERRRNPCYLTTADDPANMRLAAAFRYSRPKTFVVN